MNRINLVKQVVNFFVFVVFQWLLNNRMILFDVAFAYFYIGFLLLLPRSIGTIYQLLFAFIVGLFQDLFANTPGLNASACLTMVFLKDRWMDTINEELKDLRELNVYALGFTNFVAYTYPLILVHHIFLFVIENGGLHLFGVLLTKILASSIFSLVVITVFEYLISSRRRI